MVQTFDLRRELGRNAVPLYVQLATLFRRRIEAGQWRVGEQIPTIQELMQECGVARATIRQAISVLDNAGLVSRFRAKGTFVDKRPGKALWVELETDWSGLLSARDGASIELLSDSIGEAPAVVPHAIGKLAPRYRHLRRRHSMDGKVFLLADVYVDARLAVRLPQKACAKLTALRLAASIPGVKITDARQTLTIGAADLSTAGMMGIDLNAPICFVDRSAVDQRGCLLLIAKGIYRGDVVRVDVKLK